MSGGDLLAMAVGAMAVTAMPGVAAALLSVRLGARSVPVILCVGLVGSGALAMLTFWVDFAVPAVRDASPYAVLFGSLAVAAWSWPRASPHRSLLRQLSVPLALWALATLFVVFFGFLYGGADRGLEVASFRFATQPSLFASDSSIPLFFADWMLAGHPGDPPVFPPGWLFSDRPPLQVAYVLTQPVFGWEIDPPRYEIVGIGLQQLWVVGMWALLTAARVSARTRSLAMVGALASDVAIVNAFYVWPKLLGAAFILAALALVVAPRQPALKSHPPTVLLLAALAGFAFLAHGTSAFGLIPVAVVAVARGLPDWRWLAAGAAVLLVLVAPWMAYQQYGNPPGNRLLKWSLAGSAEIDDRGSLEAIADEYGKTGVGGVLDNKLRNFLTMAGGNPSTGTPAEGQLPYGDVVTEIGDTVSAVGEGRFTLAVSKVRELRHWHLLWTVGLLLLAVPLILLGRLRGRWRDDDDWVCARLCLLVFAVGAGCWGLLMFGNVAGRAVATSTSLALPLVGIVGIVAGLRATFPRWADWLVAASVVTTLLLFLPYLPPHPSQPFGVPAESVSVFAAIAAAAALAAFVALCFSSRDARAREVPPPPFRSPAAGFAAATPGDD